MADPTTLQRAATSPPPDDGRTIRPRRSLPGGRAVVGAFLVVVAAVGTFGAYLTATAAPTTSYMVATRGFELGHVITEADLVGGSAGFRSVAMDLPTELAARAHTSDPASAQRLLGQVVVAPIAPHDLVLASQFADVEAAVDGVVLSFSLPTDRALAGRLRAGERVDLVATFTGADVGGSETRLVARQVSVLEVAAGGEGLNGGRVTLTVEVADLATAQSVQHAVDVAQVAVLRGGDADDASPTAARSSAGATDGQESTGAAANDPASPREDDPAGEEAA